MGKAAFFHSITVAKRKRKMQQQINDPKVHPALKPGWEDLNRSEQSQKLLQWKIQVKKDSTI